MEGLVASPFYPYNFAVKGGQTFDGIRHSVITKLWAAGIPNAHTAAVVGHQKPKEKAIPGMRKIWAFGRSWLR